MLIDPPPPPAAIVAPAPKTAAEEARQQGALPEAALQQTAHKHAALYQDATGELGLKGHSEGRLALADLNGDGRPDLILNRRIVFLNTVDDGAPRGWRFMPAEVTLPDMAPTAVTAFADFDNDGKTDAIIARDAAADSTDPAVVFCAGKGDGTFGAPVTIAAAAPAHSAALAVGDVNGDGLLDFFRGNWYRKYGEALDAPAGDLFVQVAPAMVPPRWVRVPWPEDGIAFDEERDLGGRPTYGAVIAHLAAPDAKVGPVQLAQLNYGRRWNRLYARPIGAAAGGAGDRASGADTGGAPGADRAGAVDGANPGGWTDVSGATGFDGDADRTGKYPDWLLERAKTDKRFPTEPEKPFRSNGNTFDMAVGDVNGDGLFDCFVAEITHAWAGPSADRSHFLIAQRAPTLMGVKFTTPADYCVDRIPEGDGQPSRSWNQGDLFAELVDVDNDGRLDLLIASGDYPDPPPFDERLRILRQRAQPGADGRRFEDITMDSGVDLAGAGQLAVGDLDLDGDVDIVCGQSFTRFTPEMIKANGGTPQLRVYLNQAVQQGAPGMTLTLRGDPAKGVNRDAIGAVVTATVPGAQGAAAKVRIAQLRGTGGHSGKQGARQVHFGGPIPGALIELPPGVVRVEVPAPPPVALPTTAPQPAASPTTAPPPKAP